MRRTFRIPGYLAKFGKSINSGLIMFGLTLLLAGGAKAVPVMWTLQGVTLTDGGTVTGSFTYDAASNTYSNVNIITTTGSARSGATYGFVCGQDVPTCIGLNPTSNQVLNLTSTAADQTGLPGLALFFTPSLASGTTVHVDGLEATCVNATCVGPTAPIRGIVRGVAYPPAFLVRYFSNLTQGDSMIDITNTGANGAALFGPGFGTPSGNICVNVYAFSPDEQLISCCSCLVTPNGLVNLTANRDLVSNTLTGIRPNSIVVKLVATLAGAGGSGTPSACSNSAATAGTGSILATGMLAWGTTLHSSTAIDPPPAGTAFSITETNFSQATLSAGELASVANCCANIIGNGSTFGICRSCRFGGLGADKQ